VPKPILTNGPADEYLIRYGVPFRAAAHRARPRDADLG